MDALRPLAAVLLCLVATSTACSAFEGKPRGDSSTLAGTWKQGGGPWSLTSRQGETAPAPRRPQHPRKPYPYREEEVVFENRWAGIKKAGTLTLPRGKGPFPAAILITGSGPLDRDETIAGHKPFLVLADHLTRHGIAVLRTDDRGKGGSTGSKMQSTTVDLARDVLWAVAFLKGRRDINPRKIGLIGHSEGGTIAPLVSWWSRDVAFVVMLAGMCLPGEETVYLQGAAIARASGKTPRQIATQRAIQQMIFKVVKAEKDNDKAKKLILQRLKAMLAALPPGAREEREVIQAFTEEQVDIALLPWWRYFVTYDPGPSLRRLRVPLLALFGEKDLQVLPKENAAALLAALKAAGHTDYTVKVLPGLNHLFQTCKTGLMTEYGQIEETFSPKALKIISDWIMSRTR
jgi:pimeloyl-ACP methyl ester carboxylesterase